MSDTIDFQDALSRFAALPSEVRETIISKLEKHEPELTLQALATSVTQGTPLAPEQLTSILSNVSGLLPFSIENPVLLGAFVKYLMHVSGVTGPDSEKDAHPLHDQFRRLLLSERAVVLTSKAQSVLWGHGNTFDQVHIVTQIRPLFPVNIKKEPPSYSVLCHEMMITYKDGAQSNSVRIGLDVRQLRVLQAAIERAITKELSLRTHKPTMVYLGTIQGEQ